MHQPHYIKWGWVSQFIMTLIWHTKMVPMGPFYMAECVIISSSHSDLAFWVVKVLNSQYALTTLHKVGMGVPICQDPYLTPQNGSYGPLLHGRMRGYIKFSLWPWLLSGQSDRFTICTTHITLSGDGCSKLSRPLAYMTKWSLWDPPTWENAWLYQILTLTLPFEWSKRWIHNMHQQQYIKWGWVSQFVKTLSWHHSMVLMGPSYMTECMVISSFHSDLDFWVLKVVHLQYAPTTLH